MIVVSMQFFFYEDIMDPKWIFVIHYDPRLRHIFDDVSMNIEQNNDIQPIPDERLENNEEMTTHGDVQDEDVQTQEDEDEDVQAQHDNIFHAINKHDTELDDPELDENKDGANQFDDMELEESEDEDDYNTTLAGWCRKNNIKNLHDHTNIDKKSLDDIYADNNVNEGF